MVLDDFGYLKSMSMTALDADNGVFVGYDYATTDYRIVQRSSRNDSLIADENGTQINGRLRVSAINSAVSVTNADFETPYVGGPTYQLPGWYEGYDESTLYLAWPDPALHPSDLYTVSVDGSARLTIGAGTINAASSAKFAVNGGDTLDVGWVVKRTAAETYLFYLLFSDNPYYEHPCLLYNGTESTTAIELYDGPATSSWDSKTGMVVVPDGAVWCSIYIERTA